ncbi:MAG: hypothetical protein QF787_09770 [Nitrospinota bacterium]|nr:hypothetical protein [Nitrospinota bacterium]
MPGTVSFPFIELAMGIWSFSASATISAPAPEVRTPPPEMMTGFFAASSTFTARAIGSLSGSGR